MAIASRIARVVTAFSLVVGVLSVASPAAAFGCGDQFGTGSFDDIRAMATNGTGVWVGGNTAGALAGQPYKGNFDGYVRAYDGFCGLLWTRAVGTKQNDNLFGVAADAAGNSYAVGVVGARLKGQVYAGGNDAFIRSWDPTGAVRWTQEFGTKGGDAAYGVVVSGSRVYVTGIVAGSLDGQPYRGKGDAFLRAYKGSGKLLWTREFGTNKYENGWKVAVYLGDVFVVGGTTGTFSGETYAGDGDIYVRKYMPSGTPGFTTEFGTSGNDAAGGVDADATGVVVAGSTMGSFPTFTNAGVQDGYVQALDTAGAPAWTTQFGTSSQDLVKATVISGSTVWFAGDSFGGLGGGTVSNDEAIVGSVNRADGSGLFTVAMGTVGSDEGNAIILRPPGVLMGGDTDGIEVGATNYGATDGYFVSCCA